MPKPTDHRAAVIGSRPRLDSRLEAEGAEFLVLGHLLLAGIQAHKAYTRYPGYDLIASNPAARRLCMIQVKSRWATDYDRTFPLKQNTNCDFVVFAELNRGYRGYRSRNSGEDDGVEPPRFFVFPGKVVNPVVTIAGSWSKVRLAHVVDHDKYVDRWDLIRKFLKLPAIGAPIELVG